MKLLISTAFSIIFVGIASDLYGVSLGDNPTLSIILSGLSSILVILLMATLRIKIKVDIAFAIFFFFVMLFLGVGIHSLIMVKFVVKYFDFYPNFTYGQQFLLSLVTFLEIIILHTEVKMS